MYISFGRWKRTEITDPESRAANDGAAHRNRSTRTPRSCRVPDCQHHLGDGTVSDHGVPQQTDRLASEVRSDVDDSAITARGERREQAAATDSLANTSLTATATDWLFGDLTSGDLAPNRVSSGRTLIDLPGWNTLTTNHWNVHVAGEYARFTVRSSERDPSGGTVEYVRANESVPLEFDGSTHRAGTVEPVSFESRTTLVVTVPADSLGVGDRTDESSSCSETYDVRGPVENEGAFDPCAGG